MQGESMGESTDDGVPQAFHEPNGPDSDGTRLARNKIKTCMLRSERHFQFLESLTVGICLWRSFHVCFLSFVFYFLCGEVDVLLVYHC